MICLCASCCKLWLIDEWNEAKNNLNIVKISVGLNGKFVLPLSQNKCLILETSKT